ncbi:MAG TPA: ABC transporter ATP-binding protein [Streptosporangiaceae bacterium]|jgi:oligopeptide/dipeptide ABC transporter ATP-binding protein
MAVTTGPAAAAAPSRPGGPLLRISGLSVELSGYRQSGTLVSDVDLEVGQNETVGVVGETGSGKSSLILAVLNLLPRGMRVAGGQVRYRGQDLLSLPADDVRKLRGAQLSFIPSNPRSSLDPVRRVGETLVAAIQAHRRIPRNEALDRARDMLRQVGIPDPQARLRSYPFELSGGMAQRVAIALALINGPRLLLADEPTSGLDVTIQAQVLELLSSLEASYGTGTLMVTRDLSIVAHHCDSVGVMFAGWLVERSDVRSFFAAPLHPYSTSILAAADYRRDRKSQYERKAPGSRPEAASLSPAGPPGTGQCIFVRGCKLATDVCRQSMPPLTQVSPGRLVRCHVAAASGGLPDGPA